MMRFVLLVGFGISACVRADAQTPDTTLPQPTQRKASPTQQAARQVKTLEKQLHLTQDQVLQFQVILINRDVAMDSLRDNTSGNRRGEARNRRGIMQHADQQIDALLTDDQKTLYQQWKQQQRERAMERRLDSGSAPQ
jgi:periplasmic protein CpxP/Spy